MTDTENSGIRSFTFTIPQRDIEDLFRNGIKDTDVIVVITKARVSIALQCITTEAMGNKIISDVASINVEAFNDDSDNS